MYYIVIDLISVKVYADINRHTAPQQALYPRAFSLTEGSTVLVCWFMLHLVCLSKGLCHAISLSFSSEKLKGVSASIEFQK